jgi:hypothetical protein
MVTERRDALRTLTHTKQGAIDASQQLLQSKEVQLPIIQDRLQDLQTKLGRFDHEIVILVEIHVRDGQSAQCQQTLNVESFKHRLKKLRVVNISYELKMSTAPIVVARVTDSDAGTVFLSGVGPWEYELLSLHLVCISTCLGGLV